MDTLILALLNGLVVPVTSVIPILVSSGILLLVFALLWSAFCAALIRDRRRLDDAWMRIRRLPMLAQGLAWLLALPVVFGLWVWRRPWPFVARLAVIGGLAGWNLLVMLPQAG
jgi:hypothetical protein